MGTVWQDELKEDQLPAQDCPVHNIDGVMGRTRRYKPAAYYKSVTPRFFRPVSHSPSASSLLFSWYYNIFIKRILLFFCRSPFSLFTYLLLTTTWSHTIKANCWTCIQQLIHLMSSYTHKIQYPVACSMPVYIHIKTTLIDWFSTFFLNDFIFFFRKILQHRQTAESGAIKSFSINGGLV